MLLKPGPGFWVLARMPKNSIFHTHQGLYQFCITPFGLTNAPAVFQHLMQQVVVPLNSGIDPDFVSVYLDDVLILSPDSQETHAALETSIYWCSRPEAQASEVLLHSGRTEIPRPYHKQARTQHKPLSNKSSTAIPDTKYCQRCLKFTQNQWVPFLFFTKTTGLAQRELEGLIIPWSCIFWTGDFSVSILLTGNLSPISPNLPTCYINLTHNDTTFQWTLASQLAFTETKLVIPLVLAYPNFSHEFILEVDASILVI